MAADAAPVVDQEAVVQGGRYYPRLPPSGGRLDPDPRVCGRQGASGGGYSVRSVTAGSVCEARQAGARQATTAPREQRAADGREGRRVQRRHAVEQRTQRRPTTSRRPDGPERQARQDRAQPLRDDHAADLRRARPERQANADLPAPLAHHHAQGAVEADEGEGRTAEPAKRPSSAVANRRVPVVAATTSV